MHRWIGIVTLWMIAVSWGFGAHANDLVIPPALRGADLSHQGQPLALQPFQDDRGRDVSIADFKGRLTLLKIWGTFCGPCLSEIKPLQGLKNKISNSKLTIVPICLDNTNPQEIRKILERKGGEDLLIYTDGSLKFINTLGISGVPVSILVDEQGQEIWRKEGGPTAWDHADVVQHFKDILHTP